MWPVSIKQTLDGFDLFRTQSCFHMLERKFLLLLFHSLVISSDCMKCCVQITEDWPHPRRGTLLYFFWKTDLKL